LSANEYGVVTPWGLPLQLDLRDGIGKVIANNGVWDLVVSEAIVRLVDAGETVVDVGANIGYMTGLMAQTVRSNGRVIAFEPHPVVFRSLARHRDAWVDRAGLAPIEIVEAAISDEHGEGLLTWNEDWVSAQGSASISRTASRATTVQRRRLDDVFGETEIGLLKVDVEGHEYEVFRGAENLLVKHLIRDVIYEDHDPYPSEVSELLEDWGYSVFALREHLLGVALSPPTTPPQKTYDPSFLATVATDRAKDRIEPRGWRTLSTREP
jgi:FkbM family methyltransferase